VVFADPAANGWKWATVGNRGAFRKVDVPTATEHTISEPLAATAFQVAFPPETDEFQEAGP